MNMKSLSQLVTFKQQDMSMIDVQKGKKMDSYRSLYNFAYECVIKYAKYDITDGFYTLTTDNLPDYAKHQFASLIMSYCDDYAAEATGPDNKHWHTKMLPVLTRYLSHSIDRDEEIEFTTTWRECVTDYMTFKMEKLLSGALSEYNSKMGCGMDTYRTYGVRSYGEI